MYRIIAGFLLAACPAAGAVAGAAAGAPAAGAAACPATGGAAEERAHAFEEGLASWYGGEFHGRSTASGQCFDKNALSAAHRTLPFGTLLLVSNLDNGRSLELRVNDRGPFVAGRVLDCSEAAAEELGFRAAGIARVRLEILGRVPEATDSRLSRREQKRLQKQLERARRNGRTVELPQGRLLPVDPDAGPFAIQVGAFSDAANARQLAARLESRGEAVSILDGSDGLHRVRVGRHATRAVAEEAARRLAGEGLPTLLVRLDDLA